MVDLAFQLHKLPSGGSRRTLKAVGRYQEIPRNLLLDFVEDEYVSLGTPEEAGREAQRERVLLALSACASGLTTKEAAAKTQLKERVVRAALEDAYSHGAALRSGAGKKGDPFRYSVAPDAIDIPPVTVVTDRELTEV
jgi:hypothetical protein